MKLKTSAVIAAMFTAGLFAPSAQAQMLGALISGMGSALTQVVSKAGSALVRQNPADLEVEREKFYANLEKQAAGLDPTSRQIFLNGAAEKWTTAENAFLLQNARLHAEKQGPLIDFGRVAKDAAGAASAQFQMTGAIGQSGISEVVGSSALSGIVSGATDTPAANPYELRAGVYNYMTTGTGGMADRVNSNVNAAVATGVGSAVSGAVRQAMAGGGSATPFKFPEAADPRSFLGKQPSALSARELYREHGFVGWKMVDGSLEKGAMAFSPVAGDEHVQAAVYSFEPRTGAINAAFRVLTVAPAEFMNVVQGLEAFVRQKARFASSGNTLRAIWDDGTFVTADATRICVGWSQLVGGAQGAGRGAP